MEIAVKKKRLFSGFSIFLLFLAVAAFTGAIADLCVSLYERSRDSWILSQGLRAKAVINNISGPSYDETVTITYTFTNYDGESITSEHDLSMNASVWVGSVIEIAYDPANPDKNFPVERGVRPLWHIIMWTFLIFLVGIGLIVIWKRIILESNL